MFGPIDNKMHGIGIVSATTEFCDRKQYVVFISVPGHMRWISKVTGLKSTKGSSVGRHLPEGMVIQNKEKLFITG